MELSLAPPGHSSTPNARIVGGSSVLHWERVFVSFSQALSLKITHYVQTLTGPLEMMILSA